ncbi:hypothetical protein [Saccharopolyspora shandongensis]|uniref:hypothetical protein n=1 Tax=Saccharopolyspora shandongensis TaxID=418495 RepID=UPI0033E1AD19
MSSALVQIDELAEQERALDDSVDRLRRAYEYRKRRLGARTGKISNGVYEGRSLAYQQMVHMVLEAQQAIVVNLRDRGEISNDLMMRLVRELDLEEARLAV